MSIGYNNLRMADFNINVHTSVKKGKNEGFLLLPRSIPIQYVCYHSILKRAANLPLQR